jgi:uncharacterized protein
VPAAAEDPSRPLPSLAEPDTAAFWTATAAGRLTYQVCRHCGTVVFFPRSHCPADLSADLEVRESAGRGAVYTFTVLRRGGAPGQRERLPIVLGLIQLSEGFRMLAEIVGSGIAEPGAVRVGLPVRLRWEPHENLRIPLFEPDPERG